MKETLLKRVSILQFKVAELRLFLDTHPDNREATEMYNRYLAELKTAKAEYEESYGPLTLNGENSDEWLKNPWPWDN